jgi:Lrp/AsnC family leucine-responsive transcriptional regulator
MEESGVIRGYSALVDPEAVGLGMGAFIAVTLDRPDCRKAFLDMVSDMAEVQECHHVAGDDDYILKVRCAGTRGLERLISEQLKNLPGVVKTKTTIILSTVKETAVLPIPPAR